MSKNLQYKALKRISQNKEEFLILDGPKIGNWVSEFNPSCLAYEDHITMTRLYNTFLHYHLQSNYYIINIGIILG